MYVQEEFRVRAVTAFLTLEPSDFVQDDEKAFSLERKIAQYANFLKDTETKLINNGYEVQTVRIATNPFGEYLAKTTEKETLKQQLETLDSCLKSNGIEFCALGPATTVEEVDCCPEIVSTSHRLSCCADLDQNDVSIAKKAAACMKIISKLECAQHVKNGLGNFQFCATACVKSFTPFFPAARSASITDRSIDHNVICFAVGLENGKLAKRLLKETKTWENISSTFRLGMADALSPLSEICKSIAGDSEMVAVFKGFDTSLNPSLDEGGSVIAAIEEIDVVSKFGNRGSLATVAEITNAVKNLPNIQNVGYSGLMLPVCEDERLATLVSQNDVDTTKLLALSSVCGVGLDTVPISGFVSESEILSLILDVAALAFRYSKSLSCRLLLCPGQNSGEMTRFNSPYMCDCKIMNI